MQHLALASVMQHLALASVMQHLALASIMQHLALADAAILATVELATATSARANSGHCFSNELIYSNLNHNYLQVRVRNILRY